MRDGISIFVLSDPRTGLLKLDVSQCHAKYSSCFLTVILGQEYCFSLNCIMTHSYSWYIWLKVLQVIFNLKKFWTLKTLLCQSLNIHLFNFMRILIQSCVDLWLFICFNVTILWMGFDLFFGQFMNYKVMNKGYSWNLLWSKDNFRTWLSSPAGGGSVWSGLCWWASAVIDTDSGAEVIGSKVIVSSNGSITWHQDQALWSFDETKLHPCLDTDEILIRCFILFSL